MQQVDPAEAFQQSIPNFQGNRQLQSQGQQVLVGSQQCGPTFQNKLSVSNHMMNGNDRHANANVNVGRSQSIATNDHVGNHHGYSEIVQNRESYENFGGNVNEMNTKFGNLLGSITSDLGNENVNNMDTYQPYPIVTSKPYVANMNQSLGRIDLLSSAGIQFSHSEYLASGINNFFSE